MEVEKKKPELKLHSSLTETMEVFEPIDGDNVGISCCISADRSHFGLARSAVSSDVLHRYLKYLGYKVTCVMNFANLGDKVTEEASGFIESYMQDMAHLQCLPPTHQLRDSDQRLDLPPRFDIHCGNAITTNCVACNGAVNYWLLNGNPTIEKEKPTQEMGKRSRGKKSTSKDSTDNVEMQQPLENFLTRDITSRHNPLALRLFLMSSHYRSPLAYSVLKLERISAALESVYQTLQGLEAVSPHRKDATQWSDAHMEDDAHMERCAAQVAKTERMIDRLNLHLESKLPEDLAGILKGDFEVALRMIDNSTKRLKTFQNERMLSVVVALAVKVEEAVRKVLGVLGLNSSLSYAGFLEELKLGAIARMELAVQEVLHDELDLDKMDGTVVKKLAGGGLVFTELMEFITPAGNLLKCVRKICGNVESVAKEEFDVLRMLRGSVGVVQCFGDSLHQRKSILGQTLYGFYMEFASGNSLEAKIRARCSGLPVAVVARFTRMVLTGLRSLHHVGYVHGDLHPGNVLLYPIEGEGLEEAKICDVGNAKRIGEDFQNPKLGFFDFMSPEAISHQIFGTAHDIWAVGCLVLYMFTTKTCSKLEKTGRPRKDSVVGPAIPADLDEAAIEFLKLCFVIDPEKRGSVYDLLDHEFLSC